MRARARRSNARPVLWGRKGEIPLRYSTTDEELDEHFEAFRALEKSFFSSLAKASIQDSE